MLSITALGVGAGKTAVYSGEGSSAFLICDGDGEPLLLLDAVSSGARQRERRSAHAAACMQPHAMRPAHACQAASQP